MSCHRTLAGVAALLAFGPALGCIGTMEEKRQRVAADASPFTDADPFAPDADLPGCASLVNAPEDGYHFPGEDCVSCHRQAGGAPPFTIGGTLYADLLGTTPMAGATVFIDDAEGNRITLVSKSNGNFYSTDTIAFPVLTYVSLCPDVVPMATSVARKSASCNSASCHTAGFRVHLP